MISVFGITVSTAALVILLSAFNGIEDMVIKLYTDFDPDITIRSTKAKTFNQDFIDFGAIQSVPGVKTISRALEEVVILKHEQKWVHAKMLGVDSSFLDMAKMEEHLIDGLPILYGGDESLAIFGAGLLEKLDGYIPSGDFSREQITFHVPLREGKIRPGRNPLNIRVVGVSGRVNYNREVNYQYTVVPYSLANELLQYDKDITAVFVSVEKGQNLQALKGKIQDYLGPDFEVKTNFEKNELIFKTSQSERMIVFFILIFIFILSSFNLIASLAMLFVEKKRDISTLYAMGANKRTIFQIFFFEGLMISGRGVLFGLILGYFVAFSQIYFGILEMPNSGGDFFPMKTTWSDAFFITISVSALGFLASYLPTKYLVEKNAKK